MRIRKPVVWGVQYGCYKSYPAIVILAVVDANGRYTCMNAGRAGCLGDAFTYNRSQLLANINAEMWLTEETSVINGTIVKLYLVGDSASALSNSLMKAYSHPPPPGRPKRYSKGVCRTRKVVEQTFGTNKARF